ncbi:MAG: multidrug effflux MFS transporter [Pseudoalteromonas distincta]|uniref:multidrug effflux MFS transporter n=1 Tax=Pseudoalteromonas distincta TaxID=77608 RepID=UPI003F9DD3CE
MTQTQTSQRSLTITLLLSALMAFTSLSTDVYLPAMPTMQQSLHGDVELTITGFLIGFCVAQLVWGPISDRIGRKKPLIIGMMLFIIGSVGCAYSNSIEGVVFWRVFQAIGACTGPMLARAMIRDLYAKNEAAQMLSTLVMIMAVAPILGPIIGGRILMLSDWHFIFWLLALVGIVMLISLKALPESLPAERRVIAPLSHSFKDYAQLLSNKAFMRFTLCVTFYYVAAYAFITGSAKVYINSYHVSTQHYGYFFAINIVGVMLVSYFNRRLVNRIPLEKLLKIASVIGAFATVSLSIFTLEHIDSLLITVVCVFIFFSMNGVIAACATTAALDIVPDKVGSASALIGSLQYGSGIISSISLAVSPFEPAISMAWIMALFCVACAFLAIRAHISYSQSINEKYS